MREKYSAVDGDALALANPPGGTREIAETIDRNDNSLLEGRNMERG